MPMNSEQLIATFERSKAAFAEGRSKPVTWRLAQLQALEHMLVTHEQDFCAALEKDLSKSATEAWLTEISYVINESRYVRKNLRRWVREQRVRTPLSLQPGWSRVRPEPLGSVLIIAPWNYPLQLCLAPLVTALAAGNCAVIKPSELAPETSAALSRLLPRFLDPQCIQTVEGGVEVATVLLDQPWDHIVFTGGEKVAKIVMAAAARNLTPVTLELGGKSPCIVLPDADLDIAARRIIWGKFTNAGQTCIAPDHVMADQQTIAKLIPRMRTAIEEMFGPDPSQSPDYGRIVNRAHFDRLTALVEPRIVVAGGQSNAGDLYLAPTLLYPAGSDSPSMESEIFGPVLPLVEVAGLEDAISRVQSGNKPLAAYLFTASKQAQQRVIECLSAGSVCINDVLVFMAVDGLPFGGVGISGTGNYKGHAGFRQLSHNKAVLKRSFWPDPKMRYAPMDKNKIKWLRRFR